MLPPEDLARWARTLDDTTLAARELVRITKTVPEFTLEDGYRVQDIGIALREARGERVVGRKMGMTSRAKMQQMGVREPIFGVLTDRMRVPAAGSFALDGTIHPKIEPEIAFFIGRELAGSPGDDELLDACTGVAPAMEIIDSRYLRFEFELADVVADNCSSCGFVVGDAPVTPRALDVGDLGMELRVDGETVERGSSKEIYGHPLASLGELVRMLHARGRTLPAGSVVLAGAATKAIPLLRGKTYELAVERLGTVALTVG